MSDAAADSSPSDTAAFVWFFALAAALTVVALVAYGFATPHVRRNLSKEHGVVEAPTAVLFLAATAVGAVRLRRARVGWRDARWIIPGATLLAMLDEVNWIVFPLGIRRPTVLGHRVDGLHDLLEMVVAWLQRRAPWWAVLLLGFVTVAALVWIARRFAAAWPRIRHAPAWRFVALALLCVVGAQAFDVLASQRNMLARLGEELLELHAALALVFAASRITSSRTPFALRGARPGSRRDRGSSP